METTITARKGDAFHVARCPGCGNSFKQLRAAPVALPENCPVCNESPAAEARGIDTSLVVNAKTLAAINAQVQRQEATLRRMQSEIRSILSILGRESTALNAEGEREPTAS